MQNTSLRFTQKQHGRITLIQWQSVLMRAEDLVGEHMDFLQNEVYLFEKSPYILENPLLKDVLEVEQDIAGMGYDLFGFPENSLSEPLHPKENPGATTYMNIASVHKNKGLMEFTLFTDSQDLLESFVETYMRSSPIGSSRELYVGNLESIPGSDRRFTHSTFTC